MLERFIFALSALLFFVSFAVANDGSQPVELGERPLFLVEDMDNSALQSKLKSCMAGPFEKSNWSIGHRGAPLKYPEHTSQSYQAAAKMGAGIIECDVTFTKDKELVCRHSQSDLHKTTDILTSNLASSCKTPFTPASGNNPATAECRTSDITLQELKTLTGKPDAEDKTAKTVKAYVKARPRGLPDLKLSKGSLLSHKESIELIKSLGAKFTPELKAPVVTMPFDGFTQADYAQKLIDDYKAAGVAPSDVFPQSFNLKDILYWIENEPEFGKQAVLLEGSFVIPDWSPSDQNTWRHSMTELKEMGVNYIAPPLWVLVEAKDGKIVPSLYARKAKAAGLNIIAWTLEHSGSLTSGGGWYYQSIKELIKKDGDVFKLLHVLHKDVGVAGVFSDWPATTTFYANCFGLK